MENFEYVAAIDIGTTKIVAIVGRKDPSGKIEIIGMGKSVSKGVKRGVVLNIEETAESIQQAVKDCEAQAGIPFKDVYAGIAGQHIKSIKNRGYRYVESPEEEILQHDVEELTKDMYKIPIDAGEEIIHVIPQNYIVDKESGVRNPVGMSGRRLEANFHIVIGKVASAKNIQKCVNRANIAVNALVLEPLASADAVLTTDEKEAGVALVDIGGGTTDIAVFYDGIIRHTAVIPFGGNVITKDIKEGCSILSRQAEQLKVQFGSALGDMEPENKIVSIKGISGREPKEISLKTLANIIQARMEEIIEAIIFEIENSGYADRLGAGISLTGGGSMMKNLPQLMNFKTGMDVRVGIPKAFYSSEMVNDASTPIFATGVGLILKGFEMYGDFKKAPELEPEDPHFEDNELDEKDYDQTENNVQRGIKVGNGLFNQLKDNIRDIFEDKKDIDM